MDGVNIVHCACRFVRGNVGAAQTGLDQMQSDTIPQKNAESAVPPGTPNQDEKGYVFAYDVPWEEYQFV